jgi:hypothetical protein
VGAWNAQSISQPWGTLKRGCGVWLRRLLSGADQAWAPTQAVYAIFPGRVDAKAFVRAYRCGRPTSVYAPSMGSAHQAQLDPPDAHDIALLDDRRVADLDIVHEGAIGGAEILQHPVVAAQLEAGMLL